MRETTKALAMKARATAELFGEYLKILRDEHFVMFH